MQVALNAILQYTVNVTQAWYKETVKNHVFWEKGGVSSLVDFKKTGQFIQTRRKEKELTQRQLADLLGISDKTISKWETGKGMPDLTLIPQICRILEINVNELLSGEALSSNEYPEKAEANMISLMKKLKHRRTRDILYVTIGAVLIILSIYFLVWTEFAPDEWHLLNWFYEPISLIVECLLLGAFWLISSGMEEKERFKLAHKYILSIGGVLSLIPFELTLLRTDEISQLNVLNVGICLIPIFYALCICILLIFTETIKAKIKNSAGIKG